MIRFVIFCTKAAHAWPSLLISSSSAVSLIDLKDDRYCDERSRGLFLAGCVKASEIEKSLKRVSRLARIDDMAPLFFMTA